MSETKHSSHKANPIVLSDFSLGQAHMELRTTPKFLHWDRAGSVWTEMLSKNPRLTFVQGEPNKTAFSLDNKYLFSTYLESASSTPHTNILGTAHNPHRSLKEFSDLLKVFIDIVQERLMIDEYTRIGLRLIYYKSYPDKEAASQALLSTNLVSVPEGAYFGIKGSPTLPEYSIRWEEGKRGVSIRFRVESFKYELTPPLEWQDIEPVSKQHNRLAYDLDYYTIGTVAPGQFNVIEWISQGLHMVNRDTDKFLRGA
jgi:hypothetical protein